MQLLKKQVEDIFNVIAEAGYSTTDFKFRDYNDKENSDKSLMYHIKYAGQADFNFFIKFKNKVYYDIEYSPGKESFLTPFYTDDQVINFNTVKSELRNWLGYIRNETGMEDLWTKYKNITNNLSKKSGKSNFTNWSTKQPNFTQEEKVNLKKEFDDIKTMIFECASGTADELQLIKEEIENLKQKIDILNKPDFIKQIAGSIITYIPNIVTDKVAHEVLNIFKERFFYEIKLLS